MFGHGNGMLASERPKVWQSKLILVATTLVVPPDVGCFWIDGAAGGGGGGGGDPTPGGGGGGGSAGFAVQGFGPFPVVPGESLTVVIGAAGTAGGIGADGGSGGLSSIVGSQQSIVLKNGLYGKKGENPNGGGGGPINSGGAWLAGGAAAGAAGSKYEAFATHGTFQGKLTVSECITTGSSGGALGYAGGNNFSVSTFYDHISFTSTGNASGGGGGSGGMGPFGLGGRGGSNGAEIVTQATGYGTGGAGGSGNRAGGPGTQGFFRLYYLSAFTL